MKIYFLTGFLVTLCSLCFGGKTIVVKKLLLKGCKKNYCKTIVKKIIIEMFPYFKNLITREVVNSRQVNLT